MLRVLLGFALVLRLAVPSSFIYEDRAADQAIRHTIESTYNLQLSEARLTARNLQQRYPDHPVGFLLDAETYWWEAQMDPTRSAIEDQFFKIQEKTIDIGERALKAKKYPETEIKAYLASAWGSKARFRLTQRGIGLRTVLDGRNAHGYAEEVYKADPGYTDILVGIGAYNYFTGKIPAILKPLAFLFGAHGDAALGLQQIRKVVDNGRYARTEARIVLFTALMQDGAYAESLRVVEGLMADYPKNYALYPWVSEWYVEQDKARDGTLYFEKLASTLAARSPGLAQYALFEKAALQNLDGNPSAARSTLSRLRSLGTPDSALQRTLAAFERGLKK